MSYRRAGFGRDLQMIASAVVGASAAAQVVVPAGQDAERDRALDEHTYETVLTPGVHRNDPQVSVVGSNGRRLIVQRMPDGVWLGGCEVTTAADLLELSGVLAEWAGRLP